jgi:hypothetical protein
MKKSALLIFTALLILLSSVTAFSAEKQEALPEKIEMYFFYEEVCGSCDGTEEFRKISSEQLGDIYETYAYTTYKINLFERGGMDKYKQVCAEYGFDIEQLELPVFIAGGKVYQGLDNIEKNIREAYLTAGEDLFINQTVYNPQHKKTGEELFDGYMADPMHVTAVYFYRVICGECAEAKPYVDGLPESVRINGKQIPVDIVRINTRSGNNGDRVLAFFDAYDVPDEDRMVPIVFTAAGYYAGADAIKEGLEKDLGRKENMGFEFPVSQ